MNQNVQNSRRGYAEKDLWYLLKQGLQAIIFYEQNLSEYVIQVGTTRVR